MAKAPQLGITLKIDDTQFRNAVIKLAGIPQGATKAAVAAINKTLPGIRKDALDHVAEVYAIQKNLAKESMTIDKASKNRTTGWVKTKSAVLPFSSFNVKSSSKMADKKKNVYLEQQDMHRFVKQRIWDIRVTILKGKTTRFRNAFMMTYKQKNQTGVTSDEKTNVAWRQNQDRKSAWPRYGPSIPVMVGNLKVLPKIEKQAELRLEKEMTRAIEMVLARAAKK